MLNAYFNEGPLVPPLTSNSGVGVTVSANSTNTTAQQAFAAFDNNDSTRWSSAYTTGTNYLLVYFDIPKTVSYIVLRGLQYQNIGSIELLASNDGSNWTSIISSFSVSSSSYTKETNQLKSFTKFKLNMYNCTADLAKGMTAGISTFQLYGYTTPT